MQAGGTSCVFLDHDEDGDLDLFVVNYLIWSIESEKECFAGAGSRVYCNPNNYAAPQPDVLYRNDGEGSFTDVSESAGLRKTFGNGLGISCGDFDGDGWIDMYVANDGMPNQLWINSGDGRFVDQALMRGCSVNSYGKTEAGMGVQALDGDHDGDLDLFLSHLRFETNTYYSNEGRWFDEVSARTGLSSTSYESTGFGLGFADFDHDGALDLYVANGRVTFVEPPLDPVDVYAEPNQLFTSATAGNTFEFNEVFPKGGTAELGLNTSRGAAFGDLDNDGDVDIVVMNKDRRPYVLRNIAAKSGHWIAFRPIGETGGEALHSSIRIDAGGRRQFRLVQRAFGYCASHESRVHFGLGAAESVETVTVNWGRGLSEAFGPFAAGQVHALRQGRGRPVDR